MSILEVVKPPAQRGIKINAKGVRSVAQSMRQPNILRTNLTGREPAQLRQFYIQLVEIEASFKNLKDDLQLRPIYHQLRSPIEAHIFVAFMAYCLQVTLNARLLPVAAGLTPRALLDRLATNPMLDVKFSTTDGRTYSGENMAPSRSTLRKMQLTRAAFQTK